MLILFPLKLCCSGTTHVWGATEAISQATADFFLQLIKPIGRVYCCEFAMLD